MKERPIIFSDEMVRAILSGKKTMTRRIIKPHRDDDTFTLLDWGDGWWPYRSEDGESSLMNDGMEYPFSYPYGEKGDRLWVRETYAISGNVTQHQIYRASEGTEGKWKSSMFMPRSLSRIDLELKSTKVEMLHDISEIDAQKEGFSGVSEFKQYWDSLYEKDMDKQWESNPWVWVIEFTRVN